MCRSSKFHCSCCVVARRVFQFPFVLFSIVPLLYGILHISLFSKMKMQNLTQLSQGGPDLILKAYPAFAFNDIYIKTESFA